LISLQRSEAHHATNQTPFASGLAAFSGVWLSQYTTAYATLVEHFYKENK